MSDPMLIDRAVRDILNSVAVSKNLVAYRWQRPWAKRLIIDKISGHEVRITNLLNENTTHSFDNFLTLVTELNDRVALSDETMVKAIGRIRQVADGLHTHGHQLESVREEMAALENRLQRDIHALGERVEARDAIEYGFSTLEVAAQRDTLGLAELWRFAEELWWGGYGRIQRQSNRAELAEKLRYEVENRMRLLFQDRLGLTGVISLHSLLAGVKAVSAEDRDEVDLLAFAPDWRSRPLTRAILDRSLGEPDETAEGIAVPLVTTAERLLGRLLDEAKRGGK